MKYLNFSSLLLCIGFFSHLATCNVSEDCKALNKYLNRDIDADCCSGSFDIVDEIICDEDKSIKAISIYDTTPDPNFNCSAFPYLPKLRYLTLNCEMNTFPENVLKMKKIKDLEISTNSKMNIPSSIEDLDQLEHLTLTSNGIESIPEEIYKLKKLKSLDLSKNSIKTISPSIAKLSKLTLLDLSDNLIEELPEELYELLKLKNLILFNNNIQSISSSIENLEKLVNLNAGFNKITAIPLSLCNLQNLFSLEIKYNNISSIPDDLFKLKNLELIDLSGNNLESIPSSISNSTKLADINISDNKLKTIPNEIFNLSKLIKINIKGNKDLKAKIFKIDGKETIDECYFDDVNIECMQKSACKYVNLYSDEKSLSSYPECSNEDVQVVASMSSSDATTLKFSLFRTFSIIISIIVVNLLI